MCSSRSEKCLFCEIIKGILPCFKVWESETHLAFLTIYPNTKGATVVVPKKHLESYAFNIPEEDLLKLTLAAKQVALRLDQKFGIARTALIYEGYGINHVHAKLFPLHGTVKDSLWKPINSKERKYFETYQGYVSSNDGNKASDKELEELSQYLRK